MTPVRGCSSHQGVEGAKLGQSGTFDGNPRQGRAGRFGQRGWRGQTLLSVPQARRPTLTIISPSPPFAHSLADPSSLVTPLTLSHHRIQHQLRFGPVSWSPLALSLFDDRWRARAYKQHPSPLSLSRRPLPTYHPSANKPQQSIYTLFVHSPPPHLHLLTPARP